jgi:hypothetical protein
VISSQVISIQDIHQNFGTMQNFITFAFDDKHRLETPTSLRLPSDQETLAAVEVSYRKVGLIQTSAFHYTITLGFTGLYSQCKMIEMYNLLMGT